MNHTTISSESAVEGRSLERRSLERKARVQRILDDWRAALGSQDVLERAYLFVSLLQDAHLLRRGAEEGLPMAGAGAVARQGALGTWWTALLPPAVDRFGLAVDGLRAALAEQAFWRRLDRLPSMSELENLLPAAGEDFGPEAALELARLAALLREGPDGHAVLALAELASGLEQRAAQRLAALGRMAWQSTADEPYRVAQCLALGRGVLCERAGDLAGLRRELPAVAALARAPWALLGARYALALWEGDGDELLALEEHVGWRAGLGPSLLEGADSIAAGLPFERWSCAFRPASLLRLGRAVEQAPAPLQRVAAALLDARQRA